jgi:hypothetical protein
MSRRSRQIERLDFSTDGLTGVVDHMMHLSSAGDGWINLLPKIDDDDDKPTALRFFTLLSGGGTGVTMCTWIPGRHDPHGRSLPSHGITHLAGRRVVAVLGALNVPIPGAWSVEQDHPRRGLVLRIPPEVADQDVLIWGLQAVTALARPSTIRGWRADVYLPAAP